MCHSISIFFLHIFFVAGHKPDTTWTIISHSGRMGHFVDTMAESEIFSCKLSRSIDPIRARPQYYRVSDWMARRKIVVTGRFKYHCFVFMSGRKQKATYMAITADWSFTGSLPVLPSLRQLSLFFSFWVGGLFSSLNVAI